VQRIFLAVCMGACLLVGLSVSAWGQEDVMAEQTPAERMLAQGDEAFQSRDYSQAGEIYKLAAQAAEKEGHQEVLAEALAQAARSHLIRDQKKEGRSWLERAETAVSPELPLGWSAHIMDTERNVFGIFEDDTGAE
jgi:hypothetical protein